MLMLTTHITEVEINGRTLQLELEIDWAPNLMRDLRSPYINAWSIISVEGSLNEEKCIETEQAILDEYGDDAFVQMLYNEGVGEDWIKKFA
jgi:hypothetical protein